MITTIYNEYNYVYLITELSTNLKYIGSRGSIIPPEDDIVKYATSSYIKDRIKNNIHNYTFNILSLHKTRQDAYDEESRIHHLIDVAKHPEYMNLTNQTKKFNTSGITRVKDIRGNRFTVRTDNPDYISGKLVHVLTGAIHSDEYKQNMSNRLKGTKNHMWGKSHTQETKNRISKTQKGKYKGDNNPNAKSVIINNERFTTLKSACEYYNIAKTTIIRRLKSNNFPDWNYAK